MKKKVAAITTVALLTTTLGSNAFAELHQVQKGDTLTHIAKKYNTSVAQLKTLNQLSTDQIYIKQTLKVATGTTVTPVVVAPTPSVPKPATTVQTYTIVAGDTLSKIAVKHKISLVDLMKWNNLDHHIIYPGQKLKISNAAPVEVQPVTKPPAVSLPAEQPSNVASPISLPAVQPSSTEYVVQAGDTLGHISAKVGMSIEELKTLNKLSSDLIYVGQKLFVNQKLDVPEEVVPQDVVNLIGETVKWVGAPYLWGGATLSGFDCSGFIYYAFNELGVKVGRQSTEGYYSRSYYVDSPKVGDLVFFNDTYKAGISHMGIYLGNNEFIHASSTQGVTISNLNESYYQQRFDGFKRFY